ncbi:MULTISPECIES: gpW family protein [Burkholderia cepacia complex]|uniref:gpW family protein n=1 Tax=Burkholderia cepacia complex TaxID=87882 RepID=UPI00201181B7|nr:MULTISPECIES: gpW family protein [Burkholderia cepacia complex]
MSNLTPSIFAGMSQTALQQALSNAQNALIELQTGAKGVTFSYTQGDGTRAVTYQQTDIAALTALIRQLQQELGIVCRARRPIRFVYR